MTAADLPRVEWVPGQLELRDAAPPPRFGPHDRTSPPRDLADQVDRHGNVAVYVTVGGRNTWANLPPHLAAEFLRELADDLDRTVTATT